jgi:CheY-like chemotaxis protein
MMMQMTGRSCRMLLLTPVLKQRWFRLENGDALINWLHSCDPMALPSLIMLDLNMPGKDGRESLKELKADPQFQSIPIIVFTTSSSHRDKKTAYESGANCFITKPDTFDKLVGLSRSICTLWFTE